MKPMKLKPRDLIAKDLLTPKYRMRVVNNKKSYNRQMLKQTLKQEMIYASICE